MATRTPDSTPQGVDEEHFSDADITGYWAPAEPVNTDSGGHGKQWKAEVSGN